MPARGRGIHLFFFSVNRTEAVVKAMDTMTFEPDMFGAAKATYSPTKHLGSDLSRLSQIQDGKWKVVSDYVKPQP